jgi:hypothetical protein
VAPVQALFAQQGWPLSPQVVQSFVAMTQPSIALQVSPPQHP